MISGRGSDTPSGTGEFFGWRAGTLLVTWGIHDLRTFLKAQTEVDASILWLF